MRFILLYGDSEEHEITTECQIGRREGNLKFSDEHLSGVHGKFYVEDSRLYVMDLGSSNGTRINGKKIAKHVPHEVLNEDKVEMGTQTLEVKIAEYTSSIHIELPKTEPEKTSIEVIPSLLHSEEPKEFTASVREATNAEEIAPLAVETAEGTSVEAPLSVEENTEEVVIEGTHVEVENPSAVFAKAEGTYVEAADLAATESVIEKTHIEVSPAPFTPPDEATKVEVIPTGFTPPKKYVEEEKPAKIYFNPAVPDEELQPTAPLSFKGKALHVAHSLHQSFGTTQIVIVSALCLGIFAFFVMSPSKNAPASSVDRAQASTEEAAPISTVADPAPPETPIAESTPAANAMDQATPSETAPAPEVASEAENANTENQYAAPVAPTTETAEAPTPVVETPVEVVEAPKKTPKKVTAKAIKKSVAKKTSSKTRDPYNEVALLKTLTKIKSEAKRTSSYRVKAALEVDAAEAVTQHYQKIKNRINTRWKNSRSLASDEKQKVKEILQGQLIAVNNRERAVKARLSLYVHGKLNTPL